ncbi:MAG: DUF881 domain-containing protein [Eubacteriales bacterium]|nr:DUF881 domain-containing protein [Eubacteriales bacterium]
MKEKTPVMIIALICFVIGFAATLQIKSVWRNNAVMSNTTTSRLETLQTEVLRLSQKNMELQQQSNAYKNDLDRFKSEASESSDYSKVLSEDLERAELLAGLTDVTGPGIIVTINDSTIRHGGDNAVAETIHDSDLLMLLNELRNAEVEALSLNGQRIIATSEIRCSGSSVTINNVRCYAPFVIKAIGNYSKMNSTLNMPEGFMDTMTYWNIPVETKRSENISIGAYAGKSSYTYAKPAKTGGDQ